MNRILWLSVLALALTSMVFMYGCSDEDDGGGTPPDWMQLLDGNWDAQDIYADSLGLDQQRYTFSNPTDAYHLFQTAGQTTFEYSGTYSADASGITFHETNRDGTPVDTTYERNYSFSGADTVLTVEYEDVYNGGVNHMNILYTKAPVVN